MMSIKHVTQYLLFNYSIIQQLSLSVPTNLLSFLQTTPKKFSVYFSHVHIHTAQLYKFGLLNTD